MISGAGIASTYSSSTGKTTSTYPSVAMQPLLNTSSQILDSNPNRISSRIRLVCKSNPVNAVGPSTKYSAARSQPIASVTVNCTNPPNGVVAIESYVSGVVFQTYV